MKKLCLLITVLVCLSLFCGCDISDIPTADEGIETEPVSTDANTAEATEAVTPTETVTLTDPVGADSSFSVHFIDVGQADAALVLCDGDAMLIDGGNAEDSDIIYTYLKKNDIKHLEYVVATHAHEDHVGGLSGALSFSSVDTVFCPETSYDSKAFDNFVNKVEQRGKSITVPSAGDEFALGSANAKILACNAEEDTNNSSIVMKITYGQTSFLFTADAERETEQAILDAGYDLKSTLLKVGHHGSDTSTSYLFLREIMPEYAVISVGEGNSYDHPSDDTLSRLRDADVKVYRTDMQGDIICESNGDTLTFTVSRGDGADTLSSVSKDNGTVAVPPTTEATTEATEAVGITYILNNNSKKFHYPDCGSAARIKSSNKGTYTGTREGVISKGYSPCGNCDP